MLKLLKKQNRSLVLFFVITFFRWLSFWMPIYFLFYLEMGLNYSQILLMYSARNLMALIFAIPSGIIADMIGRKVSLLIGFAFQIIGFVVIGLSYSFQVAIIGNFLVGLSLAFFSGSDIAYLFDLLKELKQTNLFNKMQIMAIGVSAIALVFASLVGGFVAQSFGFRTTILLNVIAYCIGFCLVLFLKESKSTKEMSLGASNFVQYAREAFLEIKKTRIIILLFLSGAMFQFANVLSQDLRQEYFNLLNIDIRLFGIINALYLLIASVGSLFIIRLLKKFHSVQIIVGFIVVFIEFLLLGLFLDPILAVIVISSGQLVRSINKVFIQDFINQSIKSKNRATILSIEGFLLNICAVVFMPILGLIADRNGIQSVFKIFAFASLALAISVAIFVRKKILYIE